MLNRPGDTLLTTRQPLKDSPFSVSINDGSGGLPPITNGFELLDGTYFLLLDGSNLLLLGT